jgi:hypothetical protein
MPSGQVTNIGKTQKGKPVVVIDGKDKYYPGNTDITTLRVGDKISFESAEFAPGAYGMNEWQLVEGASKYPNTVQQVQANPVNIPPIHIGVPVNTLGAPVQDAERPAISNWIAAAIAAGLIKDSADLGIWVVAAKSALRADSTFQTDIP